LRPPLMRQPIGSPETPPTRDDEPADGLPGRPEDESEPATTAGQELQDPRGAGTEPESGPEVEPQAETGADATSE
jgi:hypothetical protein